MTNANLLPYYPRFIFNFNDGKCLSTADLDEFRHMKEHESGYEITRFFTGQKIDVTFVDVNERANVFTYIVNRVEIYEIKQDLDKPSYGFNGNDCRAISGKEKKWMMEIYVFLDLVS
jgi:hypothetical protein